MNISSPHAGTGSEEEKNKFIKIAEERGLVGVANDTKWNELIIFMRNRKEWVPNNKCKWISGYIGGWRYAGDAWNERIPAPFIGVEWLDISTI